jgi:hypothetical protein
MRVIRTVKSTVLPEEGLIIHQKERNRYAQSYISRRLKQCLGKLL